MPINNFKELKVWQKGMDLAQKIYCHTKTFPKEELYGLTSQVRRSALSVPSNIAEGHNRHATKEFLYFIKIALGSIAEVETQILFAERLQYLSGDEAEELVRAIHEIGRMLRAMPQKL